MQNQPNKPLKEDWEKKINKLKWKKTRKVMLISCVNGDLGFHTGSGFNHHSLTIGTLEEYGNCHYNQGIEDAKFFIRDLLAQSKSQIVEQILGMVEDCLGKTLLQEGKKNEFVEFNSGAMELAERLRLQIKEAIKKL